LAGQVGRAHVRTERVAEIDDHQLDAELGIAADLAGVIRQRERLS